MDNQELLRWAAENGYRHVALHADGRIVAVLQNPYNAQIILGDEMTVDDRWSYPTMADARHAFYDWIGRNFDNEPEGWIRHQPSNRRRNLYLGAEWINP